MNYLKLSIDLSQLREYDHHSRNYEHVIDETQNVTSFSWPSSWTDLEPIYSIDFHPFDFDSKFLNFQASGMGSS